MRPEKHGTNRTQLSVGILEEAIAEDAFVRVLDLFVDRLGDLTRLGFNIPPDRSEEKGGAPAYAHAALLKCYLYGYYYGIRSSRRLARQCRRNIEMIWLMEGLQPEYHTLSDFRKNYPEALRLVFLAFNEFLNKQDLFGKETIAVDGVKIRAQNSRKNNYSEDKIRRHREYNEKKTAEYLKEMEELDSQDTETKAAENEATDKRKKQINKALEALKKSKNKYELLDAQLQQAMKNGQTQISTTDPDSRALPEHMKSVSVSYNIQTGVDDKHCLIAHFEVTNVKDINALGQFACDTANALGTTIEHTMNVLADAGYHCAEELAFCEQNNLLTYVAPVQGSTPRDTGFQKEDFQFDQSNNTYTCPAGQVLNTNDQWYDRKNRQGQTIYQFLRYIAPKETCTTCSFAGPCLCNADPRKSKRGRSIERSQYEDALDANRRRVEQNRELYRRRQAIVEHPFGTIKRGWGYTFTLLRRMRKVSGEFSLVFTAYNMRRSVSILTIKGLMEALKNWHLNLDWVENALFLLFSCCESLWRFMVQKQQNFGSNLSRLRYLQIAAHPAL